MLLALQPIKMPFSRPENGIFHFWKCSAFNINLHYAKLRRAKLAGRGLMGCGEARPVTRDPQ